MPFGDRSDRVVTIHSTHRLAADGPELGRLRALVSATCSTSARRASFEGSAAYLPRNFTLTGEARAPSACRAARSRRICFRCSASSRCWAAIPAGGRGARRASSPCVILTHGLWQRRYGADPAIIGRSVIINDRARTVVGVMPPSFKFPRRAELYMPLRWDESPRSARNVNAVALLKPGVTIEQAQAELSAIAQRLEDSVPGDESRLRRSRHALPRLARRRRRRSACSVALMAAVGFVLLIVCANLANLLLVRGAARQREMAVRAAMGASRGQLLWASLGESVLLAVPGAAAGLLASQWALDFMIAVVPRGAAVLARVRRRHPHRRCSRSASAVFTDARDRPAAGASRGAARASSAT